ncbi:MAG: hypothetical protein V4649_03695 [Bacteroidota bacterium]
MKGTRPYIIAALLLLTTGCEIMPRNTLRDCRTQCTDNKKPAACYNFCDCIHKQGRSLDSCLGEYENRRLH